MEKSVAKKAVRILLVCIMSLMFVITYILCVTGSPVIAQASEKFCVNLKNNQKIYILRDSVYDDSVKPENRYVEYTICATNLKGKQLNNYSCKSSNKGVADIVYGYVIRFYKPGKTTITIRSGKNKITRKIIVQKALDWNDVYIVKKRTVYSKDGVATVKITNKLPFTVIGKIKYKVYDEDGNLKEKNRSSIVFIGPKQTLEYQILNLYTEKNDYLEIKEICNIECKQFAINNTKFSNIQSTVYKYSNFPYLEYYCEVENPYNYAIDVPYDVYFYTNTGKLYRIEHKYQHIKSGEKKKLKGDVNALVDESVKIKLGKVVVYQNGDAPVSVKGKNESFLRGVNVVNNASFEKSDYSMWNIKHSSVETLEIDQDGSLPVGIKIDSANAHSKERSLHFWTPYKDEFCLEQVIKDEKLVIGTYQASVYVQGDKIGSDAEIYLYVISNGKKYTSKCAKLDGYQNWKKLEINNVKHKDGDIIIGIKVRHATDGWGFVDDFNLFTPYK